MWYEDGGAYEMTPDPATLTRRYVENQQNLLEAAKTCGLAGGIYTQITDVEHEVNGFFTYDRAVEKMDFGQVRAINDEIVAEADGTGSGPQYPPGTPGLTGSHFWPADEGSGTVARDEIADDDLTLQQGTTWAPARPARPYSSTGPTHTPRRAGRWWTRPATSRCRRGSSSTEPTVGGPQSGRTGR